MYKTVLEKNGKITLPEEVIKKLGLNQGDEIVIKLAKIATKKGYYAYLSSLGAEVYDELINP